MSVAGTGGGADGSVPGRRDDPGDGALLAAHLVGQAGAFERLAARHAAMVLAVCRRVLGDGPDAEDAAQAAFLVLLRRSEALAGQRELGAWLHRAATLVAKNALRARARRIRHEREAAAMRDAAGGAGEAEALWRDCAPHLDAALDALPAAQRQALVLCYFEGLSQSLAAERLSLPESTVASRCARGLERLRARLLGRGSGLGVVALGALVLERAGGAGSPAAGSFLASVTAAAKGAAASAPVTALAEGALQTMFWTKVKTVVAFSLAAAVAAVLAPLAMGAFSGEAGIPAADPSGAPAPAAAAAAAPVPVDGLRLTLRLAPEKVACSDACAARPLGQWVKCAGCDERTGSGRHCWRCGVDRGLCEVCGGKVPAERLAVKELKAGEGARLALTFENVSRDKLRICDYLLGMQKAKIEVIGPDAASVKRAPTGLQFCLAAIDAINFPELAPGARRSYWLRLAGNPPAIDQGAMRTMLLKPGAYRLTASYANSTDSYFDGRTRQQVKPDGKVWKNTLKSDTLELKVTGEVQPPPVGGPGLIRAM